jgi:putative methyltransferase (TIGR04325 family)
LIAETRDQVSNARIALSDQLSALEGLTRGHATELSTELSEVRAVVSQLRAGADDAQALRAVDHQQLVEILRFVHDRGGWRRDRLHELRASDGYETTFTTSNPLVSIVIPTYDNHTLLRERAIPSVLAQSHENFEIVVVGDAAPDEARIAVESFGDERISFFNLPYRGPYPEDPDRRWRVAGVPPYNEGVRRARGLWIAPLDDDDAFRPHHLERLLELAQRQRLELAYARLAVQGPQGGTATLGRFPPELGQFGLQVAMYHGGLAAIFELELADAWFELPYDWGLCLRMLEAGVRIGMLDEEGTDYYPSRSWTPRTDKEPKTGDGEVAAEWEYVPEGWARARQAGSPAAEGWHADEVARAYRQKWPRFLEAVDGPEPLGVGHEVRADGAIGRHDVVRQNAVLAFAYALSRAVSGSEAPSVLDWGGALGHHYVFARRLFPELELDYHCRELPAVCAVGREVLPEVTFHENDKCFERSYELVMASNSMQYEEDWQSLLRRFAEASASRTFLMNVPLTRRHPSFVVLQRAYAYGYATEYLGWVLNREELLTGASAAGLELEREFVVFGGWPISGAPDEVSLGGFLFRPREA